jgi:RNA polymerase sigma factor (sigma-70 family)
MEGFNMDINYIYENEELTNLLNSSIAKTYYKFKIHFIIEYDDFVQECNLFICKRINSFDNEKSTLRTYIPLLTMTTARNVIKLANGGSTKANKLQMKNNTYSLDYEYNEKNSIAKFENYVSCDCENADLKLMIDEILKLKSLSEKEKEVLKLLYEGYTLSDIARILNKSRQCIQLRMDRAKEKIVYKYAL